MDKKNMSAQEECIYRTGSTHPPKSHGTIIAVLLVAVIFLSGINGVLSLMNIRLFHQLQSTTDDTRSAGFVFSPTQKCIDTPAAVSACTQLPFGFEGCALTSFDQMLYGLPQGLYVTAVTPDSIADRLGIRPGDVLICLASQPLTDDTALAETLGRLRSGETVPAEFIRDGKQIFLELTVN